LNGLKTLTLGSNHLTAAKLACHLQEAIASMIHLRCLCLENNRLGSEICRHVDEDVDFHLAAEASLCEECHRRWSKHSTTLDRLPASWAKMEELRYLDVSRNHLNTTHAERFLAPFLRGKTKMQWLNLASNPIEAAGLDAISKSLHAADMRVLKVEAVTNILTLIDAPYMENFMDSLTRIVAEAPRLQVLNCSQNEIGAPLAARGLPADQGLIIAHMSIYGNNH